MKTIIIILFTISITIVSAQNTDCEKNMQILKKLFKRYEVKQIEDQMVFITDVWGNHASIPVTDCYVVEIENGITAIAFDIYMTDVSNDYENMLREDICIDSQINESTKYKGLGERLIQVVFYDLINDMFIGKPEGFPIAELTWTDQDINGLMRTDKIVGFKKIENCTNTILLSIQEYKDSPKKLHYFFKYHEGEIMTKSLNTCIESIQEQNNKLMVHHIENCLQVTEENAVPENVFRIIFKW